MRKKEGKHTAKGTKKKATHTHTYTKWNEQRQQRNLRPYAELMPQSIVFIYQNVCKKVSSSILQYFYVIFSLWLVASSIPFDSVWFSLIPFNSITYATLTYSPCVPYADTISYKFHLVIFLKNILILSVSRWIHLLSFLRLGSLLLHALSHSVRSSSQICCSLSFVIVIACIQFK